MHVDMDAFYASVEQRDHPHLRGTPVVVGADPSGGRGVVATASYEARAYGIRSAMPITQAYRLAPHATYLPPDFARYKAASRTVMAILHRYSPIVEVVGLDEAYLDLSGLALGPTESDWLQAVSLARSLQAAIRREVGLSCSVGLGSSKSVAKMACDLVKPHGVSLVRPQDVERVLFPLPVSRLHGCGPKTAAALGEMGISTIAELAAATPTSLARRFGTHGLILAEQARGRDVRPVDPAPWQAKSRGNESTFLHDERERGAVEEHLAGLLDDLLVDQRRDQRTFSRITLKLRFAGFRTVTRALTLPTAFDPTDMQTPPAARAVALSLLDSVWTGEGVRLVGVRLSGFASAGGQQRLPLRDVLHARPPRLWRPARRTSNTLRWRPLMECAMRQCP